MATKTKATKTPQAKLATARAWQFISNALDHYRNLPAHQQKKMDIPSFAEYEEFANEVVRIARKIKHDAELTA